MADAAPPSGTEPTAPPTLRRPWDAKINFEPRFPDQTCFLIHSLSIPFPKAALQITDSDHVGLAFFPLLVPADLCAQPRVAKDNKDNTNASSRFWLQARIFERKKMHLEKKKKLDCIIIRDCLKFVGLQLVRSAQCSMATQRRYRTWQHHTINHVRDDLSHIHWHIVCIPGGVLVLPYSC